MSTLVDAYVGSSTVIPFHEAGHAVVGVALGYRPQRVELSFRRDEGSTWVHVADPFQRLLVTLAGRRAERRAPGWVDAYRALAESPQQPDTLVINAALDELQPGQGRGVLLASATSQVEGILVEHGVGLRRLAAELERCRVLDGARVAALLG